MADKDLRPALVGRICYLLKGDYTKKTEAPARFTTARFATGQ